MLKLGLCFERKYTHRVLKWPIGAFADASKIPFWLALLVYSHKAQHPSKASMQPTRAVKFVPVLCRAFVIHLGEHCTAQAVNRGSVPCRS